MIFAQIQVASFLFAIAYKSQVSPLIKYLPNAHILFCDVYKGILEIISNPKIYGTNFLSLYCWILYTYVVV